MSFFTVTAPDPGKSSNTKDMLWGLFHLAMMNHTVENITQNE